MGSWSDPVLMGKRRKRDLPVIQGFCPVEKHYVLLNPKSGIESVPKRGVPIVLMV